MTCKLNSFSYERMSTKIRFQEEAKGNSEMADSKIRKARENRGNQVTFGLGFEADWPKE